MQRYFILFSYNGSEYHGWQKQPSSNSVQEKMEACLTIYFQQPIELTAAGRTDAGVHAQMMVAHFDCNTIIENNDKDLIYHLNSMLPWNIAIQDIRKVKPEAHARFDAIDRTYIYQICQQKDPFKQEFFHYCHWNLNIEAMNLAAEILIKNSDFESFAKVHSDVRTHICHLSHAQWTKENENLYFKITADRFLRNMVRAIVGTLLDVGRGKLNIADIQLIIDKKNRGAAGTSVPAKGLHILDIRYPNELYL